MKGCTSRSRGIPMSSFDADDAMPKLTAHTNPPLLRLAGHAYDSWHDAAPLDLGGVLSDADICARLTSYFPLELRLEQRATLEPRHKAPLRRARTPHSTEPATNPLSQRSHKVSMDELAARLRKLLT